MRTDGHLYFAKSFVLKEGAPSTIAEILRAHRNLCNMTAEMVRDSEDQRLLPLCRAVASVFDRHVTREQLDACVLDPNFEPGSELDYKQIGSLDIYARSQTMLLIKTGDDADLRALVR